MLPNPKKEILYEDLAVTNENGDELIKGYAEAEWREWGYNTCKIDRMREHGKLERLLSKAREKDILSDDDAPSRNDDSNDSSPGEADEYIAPLKLQMTDDEPEEPVDDSVDGPAEAQ